MFFGLWAPAILAFFLVTVGNCFVAEYDVKVWYYSSKDPLRKPLKTTMEQESDRLCALNLHLDLDFHIFSLPIPAHWVKVRERTLKRLRFDPPPQPDFVSFLLGGAPLMIVIAGYLPCSILFSRLVRRSCRKEGQGGFNRSARTALLHLTAPAGLAIWVWMLVVLLIAIPESSRWVRLAETLGQASAVLSGILWVVMNVMIWGRLRSIDRASRLFPASWLTSLALAILSLAGIALVFVIGCLL